MADDRDGQCDWLALARSLPETLGTLGLNSEGQSVLSDFMSSVLTDFNELVRLHRAATVPGRQWSVTENRVFFALFEILTAIPKVDPVGLGRRIAREGEGAFGKDELSVVIDFLKRVDHARLEISPTSQRPERLC